MFLLHKLAVEPYKILVGQDFGFTTSETHWENTPEITEQIRKKQEHR